MASQQPIIIYRSVNRNGETFALEPESRERLARELGSAVRISPRVFIAHETLADYTQVHGSLAPQVVQILTGLSMERLQEYGGIKFRDPVTESDLPLSAA